MASLTGVCLFLCTVTKLNEDHLRCRCQFLLQGSNTSIVLANSALLGTTYSIHLFIQLKKPSRYFHFTDIRDFREELQGTSPCRVPSTCPHCWRRRRSFIGMPNKLRLTVSQLLNYGATFTNVGINPFTNQYICNQTVGSNFNL